MATTESFQITCAQARCTRGRFVPALFAHWVDAVSAPPTCVPVTRPVPDVGQVATGLPVDGLRAGRNARVSKTARNS